MDPLELRTPTTDELPAFLRMSLQGYGMDGTDAEVAHERMSNELDRSIGVRDDGEWVAGSGAFSYELTLPGGTAVDVAGITMVAVAPTHRRRGLLTHMMRRLHDDAIGRGEPLAILTASEASIYRRFGYGVATEVARLRIPSRAVDFDPPLDRIGSFALIDPHVATDELAAVYDIVRRKRTGWISGSAGWWAQVRDDPDHLRPGRTPLRAVVHRDADGSADGYATWRIAAADPVDRVFGNTLHIDKLLGTSDDVELALWRFLAEVDLVTDIEWRQASVSPAVQWRLVEPRQLRVDGRSDLVWARLLDVPTVLATRSYAGTGSLTIAVHDQFRPESGGTFRLTVPTDKTPAHCERTADEPSSDADLILGMPELSSMALGGFAPSLLAAAGRIEATSPEALAIADLLFVHHPRPHCPLEF